MDDTHARTLALPMGYRVTFKFSRATNALKVEWTPDVPDIRSPRHRRKLFDAYKAARRSFFEDVATSIGGAVAVANLTGDLEVIRPVTKH